MHGVIGAVDLNFLRRQWFGMPIILRLDIDKPFGRATLAQKVFSKLKEDYEVPVPPSFGYLKDLENFLRRLNQEKIQAISYHRICTAPNATVKKLIREGGHKFGLHAENTRSFETFKAEVDLMRSLVPDLELHSFTKHGSGELTLGKRHYAPYEPEKYREWSRKIGLPFYFGNGVAMEPEAFKPAERFYPDMFWVDPGYQQPRLATIEKAIEIAQESTLVAIIHPENLRAIPSVAEEFSQMVRLARNLKIPFLVDVP
jgi:hypothetical protein